MVQVEGQGTWFKIKELNCTDKLESSIPLFLNKRGMVEGQSKLRFAEVSVAAVVESLMRNCCLIVVVCYSISKNVVQ